MAPQQQRIAALGELLCDATRQVLWNPASIRIQRRHPGSELVCRVGHGQATYHRLDHHNRQHLITYGKRMIAAKQDAVSAAGWLSSREILRRGYFNGELSPLNLLAHTCCHEFAHLLQQVAGQRFFGSVHNHHFYTVLDQLSAGGEADQVRNYLRHQAMARGIELSSVPFPAPDLSAQLAQWQAGDAVTFGTWQRQRQGTILRVNRKTCTVDGTGPFQGQRYRVPVSMLSRRH